MECNTSRHILALDIACLELRSKKLATLRLLDLCTRICRQVSGIVISKTMY